MRILITGGAGFIGCNFVRHMLNQYPDCELTVLDKLTYAGRIENIQDVMEKIEFIKGDICNKNDVDGVENCDAIINFAAETHVDRSIIDGGIFVKTDVLGTYNLLEYARNNDVEKFVQISTDEVYGSIEEGSYSETDHLDPSSPYSASKAGAELLVKSFLKTYGLPVLITRSSNNFGPYQYPEKLIPFFILKALHDDFLPVYGDGLQVRDWLNVEDNCRAIDLVHHRGQKGQVYNIGADNEHTNIEITNIILEELNKPDTLIEHVEDRLGHDRRYSIDSSRIRELGWVPDKSQDFVNSMRETIQWYVNNEWWWKPLI